VRRVGGFIQLAFAAFWLVRGAFNLHGQVRGPLATGVRALSPWIVVVYGVRVTAGTGPRLTSLRSEAHRAIRDHRDGDRADRGVHASR
jgi:hypothetical protein